MFAYRTFPNKLLSAIGIACALVAGGVACGVASDAGAKHGDTPAHTIFVGRFVTLDATRPRAGAVAVAKGRIVGVGSEAEVRGMAAPGARRVNLPGVALPGFADAHIHTLGLGEQLEKLDLRGLQKDAIT